MSASARGWRALAVVGAVTVALDQVSKAAVVGALARGERVDLVLGFDLVNVRNRGIAFGLLADGSAILPYVAGAAIGLLLVYFARNVGARGLWLPIGLLCGGAIGNLIDRVGAGAVTDFLDPPLWPAFNVADLAIVVGIAVLVIEPLLGRSRAPA